MNAANETITMSDFHVADVAHQEELA